MLSSINCKFSKLNPYVIFLYFIILFIVLFSDKTQMLAFFCFSFVILNVIIYVDPVKIIKNLKLLSIIFIIPIIFNLLFIKDYENLFKASFVITTFFLAFQFFNSFIDDAKIFHIFYRFLPKTSLVLSISLRYYYLILKKFYSTLECFKVNNVSTTFKDKLNNSLDIFLSITNSTLEDGLILSNSIKSKSYLSNNRSYYSNFTFKSKDFIILLTLIVSLIYLYKFEVNLYFSIIFIFVPIFYDILANIWRLICNLLN